MARIDSNFVKSILEDYTIIDLARDKGWQLPSRTNGKVKCPMTDRHDGGADKHASFQISEEYNTCRCFSCGFGGNGYNPYNYYKDHENLEFPEIIAVMARSLNREIIFEQSSRSPTQIARSEEAKRLKGVVGIAQQYFIENLESSPKAIEYLSSREISLDAARSAGLGCSPNDNGRGLLERFSRHGFSVEDGIKAGFFKKRDDGSHWFYFSDRITFPIKDKRDDVVSFGARIYKPSKRHEQGKVPPKYINGSESPIFVKGRCLYNLMPAIRASKDDSMIAVVEGYMDVESLRVNDFANTVAGLGTAITENQLRLLMGRVNDICFCLDGDAAGKKAAVKTLEKALPLIDGTTALNFAFLPDGLDPDEYIKKYGGKEFNKLLYNAMPLSDMFIRVCGEGLGDSIEDRARVEKRASKMLAIMPESPYRAMLVEALAERLKLRVETIQGYLPEPAQKLAAPEHTQFASASVEQAAVKDVLTRSKSQLDRNGDQPTMRVPERRGDSLKKHAITPYQMFVSRQSANVQWLRNLCKEAGGVLKIGDIDQFISKAVHQECVAWRNTLSSDNFSPARSAKDIKSFLEYVIKSELPPGKCDEIETKLGENWLRLENQDVEIEMKSIGAIAPKPPQKVDLPQMEKASRTRGDDYAPGMG